jgi:hypothetical protein
VPKSHISLHAPMLKWGCGQGSGIAGDISPIIRSFHDIIRRGSGSKKAANPFYPSILKDFHCCHDGRFRMRDLRFLRGGARLVFKRSRPKTLKAAAAGKAGLILLGKAQARLYGFGCEAPLQ